jgi:hypothetical protein
MSDPEVPHLTDEQMNELVIRDVDDPDAWGEPVVVGPSKGPRPIRNAMRLELAARFYVLSVLHRLGADATLNFSPSSNVDLTVVLDSGSVLTVDVKTLTGAMEWRVTEFRERAGHYLVFVWYPGRAVHPNTPPDVYIVPSEELARLLKRRGEATLSLERLESEVNAREAWQRLAVSTAA